MTEPFRHTSGPRRAKIVIVGEAWGENEEALGKPFVGESGKELWRMLGEAAPGVAPERHAAAAGLHRYGLAWVRERERWLEAAGVLLTNVLALRPPGNRLEQLCLTKDQLPAGYWLPPITNSGSRRLFLQPELLGELARLEAEIRLSQPNIIIAMGNSASWATLRATNISSIRGTVAPGVIDNRKVLPTYHPAGVMRQWNWRPIVVADLMKAWRESEFGEIRRPRREILVNPTIDEVEQWTAQLLASPPPLLACDTETEMGQISMISFAPEAGSALVVPFIDWGRPGGNYWPDAAVEFRAWRCVRQLLESGVPKLWQNGMYDLQYLLRRRIWPQACTEDSMLFHHSIFPEMQKGLGFLGSVYTSEASWKLMRRWKADTEKRDE